MTKAKIWLNLGGVGTIATGYMAFEALRENHNWASVYLFPVFVGILIAGIIMRYKEKNKKAS